MKGAYMKIAGLQKLTLLDFPGRIGCTVFLGGCNLRCPFCHNGSLVLYDGDADGISESEFFAFLESRRSRLQGVCVSGGEPTVNLGLTDFIRRIKSMGFDVKLDTNGTNPEMLRSLISERLVDYVAMDIKSSIESYGSATGIKGDRLANIINKVKESATILMCGEVDFEFRTTLVRELHSAEDIRSIGNWLGGEEKYFLQTYRDEGDLLVGGFTPFTDEETGALLSVLRERVPNAAIR